MDTNTQICQIGPDGCTCIPSGYTQSRSEGDSKATMAEVAVCWLQKSGSAGPHSRTLLIVKSW
ncbi:hypothetical protein [Candidatus Nitrosocosmicus sp. T]